MRKVIILTVLVLCCAVIFSSYATSFAQPTVETSNLQSNLSSRELLQGYLTQAPSRIAGTQDMVNARYFIGNTLEDIGFPSNDLFKLLPNHTYYSFDDNGFEFEDDFGNLLYGYNMYAFLIVNPTYPTIIIGSHMDSIGQGATDNASGVVASLMIADILFSRQQELKCNVIFAYFDAEEVGCIGSEYYAHQLNYYPDSIDVDAMINLDSIAGGDNLYVYAEDKRTDMCDYLANSHPNLYQKPINAELNYSAGYWTYGYYQHAFASDHTEFRVYGIPTAVIFSGNYSWKQMGFVQSLDANNCVMNTELDTLAHFNSLPNGYNQIDTVASVVSSALLDSQFVGICQNVAKFQLVDLNLAYGTIAPLVVIQGIVAILGISAFTYHKKLRKDAILNPAEANNNSIFKQADYHDIFNI